MSNAVENLKLAAGASKPPIGIVPMHALFGVARVLEDSGVKYAPGNFMSQPVVDAVESYDSAQLRHRIKCTPLSGLVTPESYAALDEDSGLPHIDHMLAGLLILRTLMIRDGVLPEDPGQGRRKQGTHAPKIREAGDPGYRACAPLKTLRLGPADFKVIGGNIETTVDIEPGTYGDVIITRDNGGQPLVMSFDPVVEVIANGDRMRLEGGAILVAAAAADSSPSEIEIATSYHIGATPHDDPDAARRAAAISNLHELQEQQRIAAKTKQERDDAMSGRTRHEGVRL